MDREFGGVNGFKRYETISNIFTGKVQICVASRRGYVLTNATLGDFVVLRTSQNVLTQT
jgi:hypothetical protein